MSTETSLLAAIHNLFSIVMSFCKVSCPADLWYHFKEHMSEDYLRAARQRNGTERIFFQREFGVIGVLEERCKKDISDMIINGFKSHNGLLKVAGGSQNRSQAFLCGYPLSVECESGGDP